LVPDNDPNAPLDSVMSTKIDAVSCKEDFKSVAFAEAASATEPKQAMAPEQPPAKTHAAEDYKMEVPIRTITMDVEPSEPIENVHSNIEDKANDDYDDDDYDDEEEEEEEEEVDDEDEDEDEEDEEDQAEYERLRRGREHLAHHVGDVYVIVIAWNEANLMAKAAAAGRAPLNTYSTLEDVKAHIRNELVVAGAQYLSLGTDGTPDSFLVGKDLLELSNIGRWFAAFNPWALHAPGSNDKIANYVMIDYNDKLKELDYVDFFMQYKWD